MKTIAALQEYLKALYEAYDTFQAEYKHLHKRSKMHNKETAAEYYLRWRNSMRIEIRRIELALMQMLTKPSVNTQLRIKNYELGMNNTTAITSQ